MKKFLLLLMTFALVITVCACGGNEEEGESSSMPELNAVESTVPTPTPPPKEVKVVIAGEGVNIRAAANTDCEIYHMAVNEPYYLIAEDDGTGFHKILFDGKEAYIYAEYCEVKTMTEEEAEALISGEVSVEPSSSEDESEEEPSVSINAEDGQRR